MFLKKSSFLDAVEARVLPFCYDHQWAWQAYTKWLSDKMWTFQYFSIYAYLIAMWSGPDEMVDCRASILCDKSSYFKKDQWLSHAIYEYTIDRTTTAYNLLFVSGLFHVAWNSGWNKRCNLWWESEAAMPVWN